MTVKYYAILTNQGAARLANATMLGSKLNLTQMAVGDANGVLPTPDPAQTKLINQKRIAPLNLLSVDPNNQSQIIAEQIIPENEGGFWIREIGLYDDEGVLIAVANCPETYKPQLQEGSGRTQTIRMILVITNTEAITLKIDPSVVLATRKYVDDKVLELKLYVDDQMRNHIAAQDPHTQYAQKHNPTFTGEPKAPTPAAGNNTTRIATTAFVQAAITALINGAPATLDTLKEIAAAINNDPKFSTTINNALSGKQPLDETLTHLSGKDVAGLLAYLGLGETINLAAGALQKSQNGGDIPDKKQFARTIGAVTSTNITFNNASGWYKIATVVMPQATSTAVIKLYGGAGFNVGFFEQAAISELVLRAGNGSPVGITATLWRRSPTSANEVAWVNTSGDNYDIYINIGQHAYWLIAQYDYTGNSNVTLYSIPEYSSVQPGNSTSGQTYTLFNSLMKPTAGDVGALPITGGQLNGPLGIGTDNALGGNSIVLGDNDTGFKQDGDGILGIYANNARVGYIDNSGLHLSVDVLTNGGIRAGDGKRLSLTSNNNSTMTATFNLWGDANRPTVIELDDDQGWHLYSQRNPDGSIVFTVNGDITANTLRAGGAIYHNNGDIFGSLWGNDWLSTWINNNLVLDVQLGAGTSVTTWNNAGSWPNTPGYVVTSVWKDNQGENIDGINYAPLQKRVGNQWYTVQGGTV
ncbi:phage tail protein [Salmonella enterica subsp. enterica serovar Agona]|nr:phage tail protein [Salmonella enterica subsp. enterica serovar Agona]ECW2262287.1 phage tail protein [Salmonella enterica]